MIEVTLGIGAGLVLVGLLLLGAALWQAERPKENRLPGWWSLLPCAVVVIGAGTLMLLTGLDKPDAATPRPPTSASIKPTPPGNKPRDPAAPTLQAPAPSEARAPTSLAPALDGPTDEPGGEGEEERRARAQALNTEGFRAYKRRDYESARRLYREATAADPDHALAWYNLACMEAMRGDAGEALRALTRYRALVPAEDLVQKVDTDADFEPLRADEGFRRGVAALMGVAPRPAPPVGLPQGDEGDDEEELVSAGGGASDPRVLGEAALRRGAYDEAQPLLREAALGAPRDASLWFLLAQSEGGRGNVAGALFALKKYRGLKPHEDLIYKVGEDDAFGPVWRDGRFQRELGAMMAP